MTARNQPHNYRCETCEHFQTRFEYGNKKMCIKIRKKFSNSYQIGLPLYTEMVGCASHSDAGKAEQRIAGVISIDEIMGNIEQNGFYTGYREPEMVVKISDVKSVLEEALALLREKGE